MRVSRSCKEYNPELFLKVKEAVTMQQAAEYYGLRPDRKGYCLCPFHQDKNPSLKIYPNGKGFYCFTCGTGGDQITFAAKYRGISNVDAAKELAAAFHVPVTEPVSYREKREAERRRRRIVEVSEFRKRAKMWLTAYYGLLCQAIRLQNRHFEEGLQKYSWVLYMMEQVEECTEEVMKDQKAVRRIGEIEGRVNNWYFVPEGDGTVSGRDFLSDF